MLNFHAPNFKYQLKQNILITTGYVINWILKKERLFFILGAERLKIRNKNEVLRTSLQFETVIKEFFVRGCHSFLW